MKVVFVVGATATGKSAWALKLAEKFRGVIVNADSVQCFQYLQIGSAAPSLEDLQKVRHELFQFVPPLERITAGSYQKKSRAMLAQLESEKVPVAFVVGGTGLYLKALEKGMPQFPPVQPQIQEQLNQELAAPGGGERLYQELLGRDPSLKVRIHPRDHYRLIRALEVMRSTDKSLTQLESEFAYQAPPFPWPLLKVGTLVSREANQEMIAERTRALFARGFVDEVRHLRNQGWAEWEALSSVGYREINEFLAGHPGGPSLSLDQVQTLQELVTLRTCQLAKKQRTWFRSLPELHNFPPEAFAALSEFVQDFLDS